ncbi:hypothetical protein BKA70DRAFT_1246270 [Coprinopsis sp. MPI-PUGE-AT-0042]|nr:hypothetical protein BKA70DRAFT_1246270 [Coprinopsis sp. MPI-PUGE-AT-0042]
MRKTCAAMIGTTGSVVVVAKIPMPNGVHDMLPAPSVKTLTNETLYEMDDLVEEVSACIATGRLVIAYPLHTNGSAE